MKNHLNVFTLLIVILFGLSISCSKKTDFGGGDSGSNDPGVDDTPPPKNFLWIHHKAVTGALRYTHKAVTSGAWLDQCKVDLDATTSAEKDIMCITESTELDLMAMGMTLDYNVPAHASCPYITTMAPFFFQYEPPRDDGTATPPIEPQYVLIDENQKTGTFLSYAFYDEPTLDSDAPYQTPIYTAGTRNYHFSSSGASFRCGFDYSENEGPNCCEGNYTLITRTTDANDGVEITRSKGEWGGNRSNCLNGPALKLNPSTSGVSKWPAVNVIRMKEQLENGTLTAKASFQSPVEMMGDLRLMAEDDSPLKPKNFGSFEVGSLFDERFGTTRYLATYFSAAEPAAFKDIGDYFDPTGFYARYGDPKYFTVMCVDQAKEVKARIRLMIREWNTIEALQAATEPTANEDDDDNAETEIPNNPLFPKGDYLDWEDSVGWMSGVNTYPGSAF